MVVLELQLALNYSALEAGAALVPMTLLMFLLSRRAGALAQRIGRTAADDDRPARDRDRPAAVHAIAPGRAATSRRCCRR